jgi:endogenous inhibitor of DNA gyrase (YacG/DUF329 family)
MSVPRDERTLMTERVALRKVRCPACGGESIYSEANPYRPFCSQRCKNLDFGAWASEGYRVESDPTPDDEPAAAPPPAAPRR